jgi:hypothetical protein
MAIQESTAVRDASNDARETTIGTTPTVDIRTGAQPATCATADSGTSLAAIVLPADWLTASASGSKSKVGTWSGTGIAAGTPGHYRIKQGATTHQQGSIGQAVPLTTSALTAANGNVLNFAATTGVVVGMNIAGTGVTALATVVAVTGTTVTMSHTSTAGVANAAAITFTYDMTSDASSISVSQAVTINSYSISRGNA